MHRQNKNETTMVNYSEKTYGKVTVIQHSDYKWGVVNADGEEVVPFGKYDWIDGFDSGLARVKIGKAPSNIANNGNKWGIINEKGEEVLPVEYDSIWKFLDKNRFSTRVEKDGDSHDVYLHDLNPALPVRGKAKPIVEDEDHDSADDYDNDIYDYGTHYGDFAGTYAQEYGGLSDDAIYDAFDGDPDAYWNID